MSVRKALVRKKNPRSRETHDPIPTLPSTLLSELLVRPQDDHRIQPPDEGNKEPLRFVSRKERRKRVRKDKKRATSEARTQWKLQRTDLSAHNGNAKSHGSRKRKIDEDESGRLRPSFKRQKAGVPVHDETEKKIESVSNTTGQRVRRAKTLKGDRNLETEASPGKKVPESSDKEPSPEDHDLAETRRLEKLLGINRKRKRKEEKGKTLGYADIFGEADEGMLELLAFCDSTIANSKSQKKSKDFVEADEERKVCAQGTRLHRNSVPIANSTDSDSDSDSGGGEYDSEESQGADTQSSERDSSQGSDLSRSDSNEIEGSTTMMQSSRQQSPEEPSEEEVLNRNFIEGEQKEQKPKRERYVPPSVRNQRGGTVESVKRRMRGLLNRVADVNASGIAQQVVTLCENDGDLSRRTLADVYAEATISAVKDGSGIGHVNPYIQSHGAIASHLAGRVDGIFLATLLVSAVRGITTHLEDLGPMSKGFILVDDEKNGDAFGYVALICSLYERKAICCKVVYDLVRLLAKPLLSEGLELLLLLLRQVGALLRMDDPANLKEVIEFIHTQATPLKQGRQKIASNAKLEVMLGLITDIKNNKVKRSAIKENEAKFAWADSPNPPLSASISDLLDDTFTNSRWWDESTGLSMSERRDRTTRVRYSGATGDKMLGRKEGSTDLSGLASSLRLNTQYRKAVFTSIMSSTSVSDAYERLEQMGAFDTKKKHDRDAALVLLHCCGSERVFNPFYGHVVGKLCNRSRESRFTFEFALWDIFKAIPGSATTAPMNKRKMSNYSELVSQLWSTQVLSFSVLRQLGDLDECSEQEQTFARISLVSLISKLWKMRHCDRLGPFTKLLSETWSGVGAFRVSLSVFLRRHVMHVVAKDRRGLVAEGVRILEDDGGHAPE